MQSPSVRLIVERERERIAFVQAGYWDIDLLTATVAGVHRDARRARRRQGRDRQGLRQRRSAEKATSSCSTRPAPAALGRRPRRRAEFTVRSVEERPYRSAPKAPFMTSTLQQEGGRKLRLSRRRR